MPLTEMKKIVEAVKLDIYDLMLAAAGCLETLTVIGQASGNADFSRELDEMHGIVMRMSARVRKLSLEPTTHDEPPAIEVVEVGE